MTALLERDHLLTDLSTHLDHAVGGRGRLILLHGEAGVGKTSLLEAAWSPISANTPARSNSGAVPAVLPPVRTIDKVNPNGCN
jgi:recombinational DNA repair ATPase RecF